MVRLENSLRDKNQQFKTFGKYLHCMIQATGADGILKKGKFHVGEKLEKPFWEKGDLTCISEDE